MSRAAVLFAGAGRNFPALLIWAALTFNWFLAFVNARGIAISAAHVAACELLIMLMAVWHLIERGLLREQLIIFCVYALCVVFTLFRFAYAQDIEPKPLRDLAIIFVFLSLGLSARRGPYRLTFYASIFIALIGLLEVLLPQLYSTLFNVKAYYISSRGYVESQFWNTESTAFVSGTRPGERYFAAFTQWPRASSIFLEPVSLGNFLTVSLMVLLSGWSKLSLRVRGVWSLVLLLLLVLSDSRFAFASGVILIALRPLLRRTPQQLSFVLFASVVGAAAFIVWFTGIGVATDDFLGRLFYTVSALQRLDVPTLFGMKYPLAENFMDSGLVYFIVSQSLVVVLLLPLVYSIGLIVSGTEAKLYKHYLMIVLALNLMISNSLFSIKVAALLWFCVGALGRGALRIRSEGPALAPQPRRMPG